MQVEQLQVVHVKFVLLPEDVPCQCLDMGKRTLLRMMPRRLVEVEETAYYGLIIHMVGDSAETVILRDGCQIVPAVVLTERLVVPHDAFLDKTASDKRHVCKFVERSAHTDERPVPFSFFGHVFQQPFIVFLIHLFLT